MGDSRCSQGESPQELVSAHPWEVRLGQHQVQNIPEFSSVWWGHQRGEALLQEPKKHRPSIHQHSHTFINTHRDKDKHKDKEKLKSRAQREGEKNRHGEDKSCVGGDVLHSTDTTSGRRGVKEPPEPSEPRTPTGGRLYMAPADGGGDRMRPPERVTGREDCHRRRETLHECIRSHRRGQRGMVSIWLSAHALSQPTVGILEPSTYQSSQIPPIPMRTCLCAIFSCMVATLL